MVTAWYGMIPTGNQAGEAIHMLVEENKAQHPWHCPPQLQQDTSISRALTILRSTKITRKVCMTLLAEFYDPVGLFKPIKLQYKLALLQLNKFNYREAPPPAMQAEWRTLLADLAILPDLKVPRCVLPDTVESSPLRLLCLSDAGEQAGGGQ